MSLTPPFRPDWRAMAAADLPAVLAVADVVHPGFPERPEVFAERLALFAEGCHVLAHGDRVLGYIVSHPWFAGSPVPLDTLVERLPAREQTRYLHDIALMPEARGAGLAVRGVSRVIRDAYRAGVATASLVAVNGSGAFWARQGFVPVEDPAVRRKLAPYGDDAAFMVRDLST